MSFVFRAVDEVGAALNTALVVLGDKLGYYRTMATLGPVLPTELAERSGTRLPYAREWLNAQAAGGFVEYDPTSGRYTLPPEHAVALTDESSPAFLPGLFQIALGTIADSSRIVEAARSDGGLGWHEHSTDVHHGCERFFRPSYEAYLVSAWLPAVGMDATAPTRRPRGRRGVRPRLVHDPHGAGLRTVDASSGSTITRHPSRWRGSERRRRASASARTFEVAAATEARGAGFDLVTTFDSLHDMGDPVGAARRIHDLLVPGGTWMIVEPMAGDRVEDNFNPVGRAYYGFSTLLCTPASLSQEVGAAIGTQAGPARIGEIVTEAGFTHFRSAAETPFHRVLEARRD